MTQNISKHIPLFQLLLRRNRFSSPTLCETEDLMILHISKWSRNIGKFMKWLCTWWWEMEVFTGADSFKWFTDQYNSLQKLFQSFLMVQKFSTKTYYLQRVIFNHFVLMHRKHVKKRIANDYIWLHAFGIATVIFLKLEPRTPNWCFFFFFSGEDF